MESRSDRFWLFDWHVLALIALVVAAYFVRLGDLSVRGEESRWATIAIEMMRTGDWVVPRQQGEPFFSRPPLGSWLIAGAAMFRGQCDAVAIRLPTASAVLGMTLLVYAFGRTFMGRTGAFAAALAIATMGEILQMGRLGESDVVFAFLLSAAWIAWLWCDRSGRSPTVGWMIGYGLAGLAALQKGPQGPVCFATAIGLYLTLRGDWRRMLSRSHALGLLTFAIVVGAWQAPFFLDQGWAATRRIWLEDSTSRFRDLHVSDVLSHLTTYPLEVLGCTAPWSFLLLAFLSRRFRQALGATKPIAQFLMVCVAVGFAPCWLSPGGMTRYVIPLYPSIALLVGLVVDRSATLERSPRLSAWCNTGKRVLAYVVLGTPVAFATLRFVPSSIFQAYAPAVPTLVVLAGTAIAAAALVLRSGVQFRPAALFAVAGFMATVYGTAIVDGMIRRSESTDVAVAELKERLPPGTRLVSFYPAWHLFAFHFGDAIELRDLPDADRDGDVTWFCYSADEKSRMTIPFEHEVVAVVSVDRNHLPVPKNVVVVCRRIAAGHDPIVRK